MTERDDTRANMIRAIARNADDPCAVLLAVLQSYCGLGEYVRLATPEPKLEDGDAQAALATAKHGPRDNEELITHGG